MSKPKTVSQFLSNHLWQIGTVAFVGAIALAILQIEYKALLSKVEAIETTQAEYPSKEWFVLKFESEREYTDLKFEALEKKIDDYVE